MTAVMRRRKASFAPSACTPRRWSRRAGQPGHARSRRAISEAGKIVGLLALLLAVDAPPSSTLRTYMTLAALAVSHLAWSRPSPRAAATLQPREFGDTSRPHLRDDGERPNNGLPEAGALPENVYDVALPMPLGINFEDNGTQRAA